jgi:hypothetical protein
MDLELVRRLMVKWAVDEGTKTTFPPEARFVTGDHKKDGMLHHFQVASGLEVELTEDFANVEECKIVDEKKFMLFVLRWS